MKAFALINNEYFSLLNWTYIKVNPKFTDSNYNHSIHDLKRVSKYP